LDIVKYLIEDLENPANIHANNDEALRFAAYYNYLNVVKYLVEGPPNPKRPWHPTNIHANNDEALCNAAENNSLDVVKYLIDQGADINVIKSWDVNSL
jgi:ankyrin repeat protein